MTARGGNVDSTRAAPPLHDALRPVEGGPVPGQSSHDTNARHFLSKSIIDPNVPGTGAPKRRLRVGRSPNGFARRGPKRRHFVAPLCDRPAHEAESTMSSWSTVTCSIVRGQARRHRPTTTCQPRRRQPRRRQPRRRLGQRCRGQNLTSDQKYLLRFESRHLGQRFRCQNFTSDQKYLCDSRSVAGQRFRRQNLTSDQKYLFRFERRHLGQRFRYQNYYSGSRLIVSRRDGPRATVRSPKSYFGSEVSFRFERHHLGRQRFLACAARERIDQRSQRATVEQHRARQAARSGAARVWGPPTCPFGYHEARRGAQKASTRGCVATCNNAAAMPTWRDSLLAFAVGEGVRADFSALGFVVFEKCTLVRVDSRVSLAVDACGTNRTSYEREVA